MINLKDDGGRKAGFAHVACDGAGSNRAIMQRQERAENRCQMKTKNMDKTGGGAGISTNSSGCTIQSSCCPST